MPPANDLALTLSQDNSSDVFLVVLVVLGSILTYVIPAGLQDETCFTIFASIPMIVDILMSTLCSFIDFHVLEYMLASSSMFKSLPFWYAFGSIVRVPSSAHEYFVARMLRPQSCGSRCSRMSCSSWWM